MSELRERFDNDARVLNCGPPISGRNDRSECTPDDPTATEDIRERLRAFHTQLPDGLRKELDLVVLTEMPQRELAALLGITQEAFSKRAARVKREVLTAAIEAGLLQSHGDA